jgi:hypothetical protein
MIRKSKRATAPPRREGGISIWDSPPRKQHRSYVFESGISNDIGDDFGDTGNACIRGAGVSNIGVEDIGAGSDGIEDKE